MELLHSYPLEKVDQFITPPWVTDTLRRNEAIWNTPDSQERQILIDNWCSEIKSRLTNLSHIKPHISVIIPAKDEEHSILQILDSLSRQKYAEKVEVIVVANNCSDSTSDLCRDCGIKVIEYNKSKSNPNSKLQPIACALNIGVNEAQGDIIFTIGADCIAGPRWIEKMSHSLDTNPNVSCTSSQIAFFNHPTLTSFTYDTLRIIKRNINFIAGINSSKDSFVRGPSMAARKIDLVDCDNFDPRRYPGEDVDASLKLKRFGKLLMIYYPEASVWVSPRRLANLHLNEYVRNPNSQYFSRNDNVPEFEVRN